MSSEFRVYYYLSPSGKNPVKEFINSLTEPQRAKIRRIFQYIELYGLSSILPHVKKLVRTPLWEIRILGKDNIRILYVIPKNEIVLVLHGFTKKTQKTPQSDLSVALERYKDWQRRSYLDK